jgi:hypothetical protein
MPASIPARPVILALGLCLSACLNSGGGGGPALSAVALGETRLAGNYGLVNYLVEYNDGRRFDTSNTDFTGTLAIGTDSGFVQRFRLIADTTEIRGKISAVRISGGRKDKGEISITLVQDGKPQESLQTFQIRADTLVLTADLTEAGYLSGYRETDYYVRNISP